MLLGEVLSIVRTVEVIASDRALGTGHVAADDEVSATEVLADHHVLDGLTRSSHVHRVGKVVPSDPGVLGLLRQAHVCLVANGSRDVVSLGGATGWMHEDNTFRTDFRSIESASEELVMSTMNGISALECNNILVIRKVGPNLSRSPARELTDWEVEALKTSTTIESSTLSGNHQDTGMLQRCDSIALLALVNLVWLKTILNGENSDVTVSLLQQHFLSWNKIIAVGVEYDGEAEEKTTRQPHVINNLLVGLLVHEPVQWRKSTIDDQLYVAKLTISKLVLKVA
mmetsp:Transcript_9572/g.32041  ORF Transcript_9572/g.32041 Transcript_9572/m.32041 type:complete len:284 (+) Transcript_9572:254-1105(+)